MVSGSFHGSVVECMASMCVTLGPIQNYKKGEGERDKESWRRERKKGRELKINKK